MIRFVSLIVAALTLHAIAARCAQNEGSETTPLPAPLPLIRHPADNAPSAAKIALGRELFFDTRLSRNDKIACATCHDPARGFSNGERFAVGIDGKPGNRNVPGLTNVGHSGSLFWDGRAASLEEQALQPIQNPKEMDMPLDALVKKFNAIPPYRQRFGQVFGGEATAKRIGQAIAAYERTLIANDTPFDRYLKGDRTSLSPRATSGMRLFFGQARCATCHSGSHFSDEKFHNIGTADPKDPGRKAVTGQAKDHGAFRTPQLRDVGRTAPYMHDGRFKTLTQVVQHYNFGGVTDEPNDLRDEQLQVLYLSEDQVADLVAFLSEGLASPPVKKNDPPR